VQEVLLILKREVLERIGEEFKEVLVDQRARDVQVDAEEFVTTVLENSLLHDCHLRRLILHFFGVMHHHQVPHKFHYLIKHKLDFICQFLFEDFLDCCENSFLEDIHVLACDLVLECRVRTLKFIEDPLLLLRLAE
jgi:hypothetical protein